MDKKAPVAPAKVLSIGEEIANLRHGYQPGVMTKRIIPAFKKFFPAYPKKLRRSEKDSAPAESVAPVVVPAEEERTVEQLLREVAVAVKKQKLSFTTFTKLFSVLKFTVSKHSAFKKDKTLNNRFGEAVIVLGSAYLTSHYTKDQTEEKIAKLVNLLNFVEDATIVSRLEKSLAAGQQQIFQVCLAALIQRKKQSLVEAGVFQKLLDEYFIDAKKRDVKGLVITPLIAKLITTANLKDVFAPKLILLLKRSEDNVETVISVLSTLENIANYDSSAWAVEAVLTHLKPYYYSLVGQANPSKAALSVIKFVKSAAVLQQIVDGLGVVVGQTNDEKKRTFVLRILEGAAIALKHVEGDTKGVTAKVLQIISDNAGAIQDTNDLEDFMRIIDTLIANSSNDYVLSADLATSMKKKIAIQQVNKLVHAVLCKIVSTYIRRYSGAAAREHLNEVKELVDAIVLQIVSTNLKTPAKLVTNSEPFLAALEVSVLAANYAPLAGAALTELKKSFKSVVLSEKTIFNRIEFFQKISQVEANLYFRSILLATQLPETDLTADLPSFIPLSNSFIQLFFGSAKQASSSIVNEEIRRGAIKNWLPIVELLSQGLFNFLFYKLEGDATVNVELLHHAIRLLQFGASQLTAEQVKASVNAELTAWVMFHPLTHQTTLNKFKLALTANESAQQLAYKEVLGGKNISNPYVLISDIMLQNANPLNRRAAIGYAGFLIDLNLYDFLEPYRITLDIANYELKNSKNIEEFERIVIKHSDDFEASSTANLNLLIAIGYSVQLPVSVVATLAQEQQLAKKAGGAAGKKPAVAAAAAAPVVQAVSAHKLFDPYLPAYRFRTGHSFLDDEELIAKRKEELRERMVNFYRLSCEFFKLLSTCKNADVAEYFFTHLNEGFFGVAQQKQTHVAYRVILANILRKYRAQIKAQALFLADFTITIAQRENPSEKMIREFINFQTLINSSLNSEDVHEAYIIPYIHKLNSHTIKEDGFDMDTKGNALVFYKQLSAKYNDYLLGLYEAFNATINTLAASPVCQVLLEKVLLLIKREDTSLLFRNILNNVPNAKKCVLSSIINQSASINYTPSFEEIIKLRIMQIDNNKDVIAYATQILSSIKYELSEEAISKFDIVFFVVDHSIENVDKFSELCLEIIKTHPKLHKVIFTKLTDAAEKCYDQKITEEALTFYPKYVMQHIGNIQAEELPAIFNLLVQKYCNPGLNMLMDISLQCGIELINKFGSQQANNIVNIFDKYLKSTNQEDANKQLSAIVFLGVCAPYIKNKSLIENVSSKIILLFKNGTENLQKSLAKCLPQLMNFFENAKGLIEKTIQSLPFEPTVAQKKGQAYLIAGLIKGLGVAHIEKLNIFKYIDEDLESKKDVQQKESILLLVTCFLEVLGRVFEPFITRVMKVLMHFFGETNESIKEMALNATKLLMSRLTGYGVKLILPQLLLGLEDSAWRAKFNNIWALGNMAFCSPKQMSQCLPQIVPQLSNCLSDTHPKIREVANSSLTLIGSSIKNPEISEIVDILIQALSDPFDLNKSGLEVLLKTRFTHYIDAPALSLVIPIVDYALTQKREIRPKEDACQVVGSISSLIKDPKDIIPYMDILVAGLRNALSDNDNEVRLFASKAIGQICKTLGQTNTEKYFRFIKDILESKQSTSIERSGAAQAQSEIMCTLGINYFKAQLPSLFEKMGDKQPWVREGYIGIFVFVPVILKDNFNQFIKEVLDVTSEFVADEDEKTREIALRVLRILIQNFGETQTQLLTGPVNEGLFSANWRKRLSCVVLSSEMLDILQKMVRQEQNAMTEDENIVSKKDETPLSDRQTLLYENFMAVYILRADEMEHIRLQSSQVWKNFVDNTPRTLKIGLKILFSKLTSAISRGRPVETIAKTAVFNFCQKYGESFFPQVLKVFKEIIAESSSDLSRLRGSILVLAEYSKNLSGSFLKSYQDELVDIIKVHVYTPDNMFRASVFYALRIISERIGEIGLLKNTLNEVFERIRCCTETDPLFEIYLKIFDQLCQSKSDRIMQYIVPQLFHRPIPSPLIEVITNNSEIIAKVSYKFFTKRSGLELLFDDIFEETNGPRREALVYAMNQLSVHLSEDDARLFLLSIVDKINEYMKTYSNSKKDESELEVVLNVLKFYMINTPIHLKEFNKDLINLVNPFIFDFNSPSLAKHAAPIIGSIFSILNKKYYVELLHTFSLSIEDSLAREKYENITEILGFNVGEEPGEVIRPFIELATTCLVYEPLDSFQDAIDVLKYIVKFTRLENLAHFNLKLTGPLIRVANYKLDRHDKKKILQLFVQMQEKGMKISAFVPQLTATYMKVAHDFAGEADFQKLVGANVKKLVEIAAKPDNVLRDIYTRAKENIDDEKRSETYLNLSQKLIKINETPSNSGKLLFAKAATDKIFTETLRPNFNDNLSQKATGIVAKIAATLSVRAPAASVEAYVKDSVAIFKKPTQAKTVFSHVLTVLQLHKRNAAAVAKVAPISEITAAIVPIIEKYDKPHQLVAVEVIQKIAKSKTAAGQGFAALIPAALLAIDVKREWALLKGDDEDGIDDVDVESDNGDDNDNHDSDNDSLEEDDQLNFNVE